MKSIQLSLTSNSLVVFSPPYFESPWSDPWSILPYLCGLMLWTARLPATVTAALAEFYIAVEFVGTWTQSRKDVFQSAADRLVRVLM